MKWVTRARPKTDRIACPWLIRRFIDPDAEILYVPTDQVLAVAEREGAPRLRHPGRGVRPPRQQVHASKCSSTTTTSATTRRWFAWPASCTPPTSTARSTPTLPAPALLAIAIGGLDVEADDHRLLERASFVYDALYAWCVQQVKAGAA